MKYLKPENSKSMWRAWFNMVYGCDQEGTDRLMSDLACWRAATAFAFTQ